MVRYLVGGYVRDQHLGVLPKDKDWIVLCSNEEELLSNGLQRVGKDYPVYLDKNNGDVYAIAEMPTGFQCSSPITKSEITTILEYDLLRRDFTINAMVQIGNEIFDPYNGLGDIKNCVLRHVSDRFNEDPIRVLRLAKFHCRYNFNAADETVKFIQKMDAAGELHNLSPQRIWPEIQEICSLNKLAPFFKLLRDINVIESIFPIFGEVSKNNLEEFLGTLEAKSTHEADTAFAFGILIGCFKVNNFKLEHVLHFCASSGFPAAYVSLAKKIWLILTLTKSEMLDSHQILKQLSELGFLRKDQHVDAFSSARAIINHSASKNIELNNLLLLKELIKDLSEISPKRDISKSDIAQFIAHSRLELINHFLQKNKSHKEN